MKATKVLNSNGTINLTGSTQDCTLTGLARAGPFADFLQRLSDSLETRIHKALAVDGVCMIENVFCPIRFVSWIFFSSLLNLFKLNNFQGKSLSTSAWPI